MSCQDLIASLKGCVDGILGIRDGLGAVIHRVYFVTRTWSGAEPGLGTPTEVVVEMDPQPGVVDYSHSIKVTEGGAVKQGDLIIQGISKNAYPLEADVARKSTTANVEKFYRLGTEDYWAISIVEKQLTWNVQIRRQSR